MTRIRRIFLILAVLLTCVGCDQISKIAARNYLSSSQPTSYLGGMVSLQYTENLGAVLSFGSTFPSKIRFWVFTVLTGIALSGMVLVMLVRRSPSAKDITSFSLIVAGGAGNLVDRLLHQGAVIDFLNVNLGGLHTGIFNIADVAIVVGAGMLILPDSQKEKRQRRKGRSRWSV